MRPDETLSHPSAHCIWGVFFSACGVGFDGGKQAKRRVNPSIGQANGFFKIDDGHRGEGYALI